MQLHRLRPSFDYQTTHYDDYRVEVDLTAEPTVDRAYAAYRVERGTLPAFRDSIFDQVTRIAPAPAFTPLEEDFFLVGDALAEVSDPSLAAP